MPASHPRVAARPQDWETMSEHKPVEAQRRPPTGTITFLFTDIEGSTRLVDELGPELWPATLERHREIMREAIAGAGGFEVQTDGDSFFVVFSSPDDAARAVVEAQKQLSRERWAEGVAIAVRMGLHTGDGTLDLDGSYVGADVHHAARVAAAANGGQVLLSDATLALIRNALPTGTSVTDLGRHRLKDLRPERLNQLNIDGLRDSFPPLDSVDSQPNNLPTNLTSFVGREEELRKAGDLLARSRLLTLTGPGGTGKTRLSLQLAADQASFFPEGIWFVALEPIHDLELVPSTIAQALGIGLSSSRPAADILAEWIGHKRILLVLDNFEQVIVAAPSVSDLLRRCSELKIVCTSRSALHVAGEQEFEVPGLPAPPDLARLTPMQLEALPEGVVHPAVEAMGQYEAVRLFIARSLAVRPDFAVTNENAPAVAQICARLHGMPLAIELAAARVKLLTPQQILARLEHQLTLLTSVSRDLPERQRTLRGAIAWSYDLLDEALKALLAKLSVFNGGWDLEAAEAVAPSEGDLLDDLAALVDQSLVRTLESDGTTRFDMLPTIRAFLTEILVGTDELGDISDHHATHYRDLAEEAAPLLNGDRQRNWMDRIEREHDNIRAALQWTTAKPDPESAIRLGYAMWRFWQQRGYVREARLRLDRLQSQSWNLADEPRARLMEASGNVAYWQADNEAAERSYQEALTIWRKLGDKKEIANAIYNLLFARLLPVIRGEGRISEREVAAALKDCDEALTLYRDAHDRAGEGNIIWALATLHHFAGEHDDSERLFRESSGIFREVGQRTMEAWASHMLTLPLVRRGRLDAARKATESGLRHFHEVGNLPGVAMALRYLAGLDVLQGDRKRSAVLVGAAAKILTSTGADLTAYLEHEFASLDTAGALSATELDALYQEGAARPLDEVVARALIPRSIGTSQ